MFCLIHLRAELLCVGELLVAAIPSSAFEAINAARRDPDVLRILSEQVAGREDLFTGLIASAQSSGDVADDVDPRATARFMLSVLIGTLIVQAMDLPELTSGSWESFMTRLVDTFRPQENQ